MRCGKFESYSITSSARASSVSGSVIPRAFVVERWLVFAAARSRYRRYFPDSGRLTAPSRRVNQSDTRRLLLLLNTIQIIDNSEDACSHDDFSQFARRVKHVISRVNNVRQVHNGVESFSPNWHFTRAVSGNCFRPVYGFINSVRGKDPVVVPGQDRQIRRRYLELLADRSFALSIRTMAACARRLKFCLAYVDVFSLSRSSENSRETSNHQPLQAIGDHIVPPPAVFG